MWLAKTEKYEALKFQAVGPCFHKMCEKDFKKIRFDVVCFVGMPVCGLDACRI